MDVGKQLKYGQISGGNIGYDHILTASQVIVAASGKFVVRAGDGTDTVDLADNGDADILGHMEVEAIADTAGTEVRKVVCDPTAVYRIPINTGTYTHLMKGKDCDLDITSDVQGADLSTSTDRNLRVINGDLVNNAWVDVMVLYQNITTIGVDVT